MPGKASERVVTARDNRLGKPVRLLLTPGQVSEYSRVEALIEGFTPEAVLADKD